MKQKSPKRQAPNTEACFGGCRPVYVVATVQRVPAHASAVASTYVPAAPVPVRYMVRYMVRYNSSVHCTIQRITMHVGIPSIVRAELRANTFGQVVGPGCWARFAEFTIYLYTVAGVLI